MARAFVAGGLICVLGQGILNFCMARGLDQETAGTWCSVTLIFLSALTTGLNLYPRFARWAGAGSLVPITGFANSVAAPAIEYQKEGQVLRHRLPDFYHCRSGDSVWNSGIRCPGTD